MELPSWPSHLLAEAQVRLWISTILPTVSCVDGPIRIEQVKSWGVVARFRVQSKNNADQEVIFKASHLPLFTYGPRVDQLLMVACPEHVPVLLGWQVWEDKAWMLYRPFAGPRVSATPGLQGLRQIAQTFAHIQTCFLETAPVELVTIPRTSIAAIPSQFEAMMSEISNRQWPIWHDEEPWLMAEFHIPDDLIPQMRAFTPQVASWAVELADMAWPDTIEHADLQADNAALDSEGRVILFDWEEATVGCPFFSLHRLLDDAHALDIEQGQANEVYDGAYSPNELAVRQTYIEALPWHHLPERERAFDLAMCLAPIRAIHDGILFAAAQGWPKGIPPQVAMLSSRALRRWERFVQ